MIVTNDSRQIGCACIDTHTHTRSMHICMYTRNAHRSLLETGMPAIKAGATEIRGRRKERGKINSFKCEISAETIFCLFTPSSCSPQPCSTKQSRSHSTHFSYNTVAQCMRINFCTELLHRALRWGTSQVFWGLVTNTLTLARTSTAAGLSKCVLLQSSPRAVWHRREQQCQ